MLSEKARIAISAAFSLTITLLAPIAHSQELPEPLIEEIATLQDKWGGNPAIISAVKEQNAKGISLSSIQSLDKQWQASSGLSDFMYPFFENSAADILRSLEEDAGYVMESFVMDNQGAIVAATNKTSDYWQGDEAKFTDSYENGAGSVHIGDIEFDDSAQSYLVQVSVPVMSDGVAIGAITIGIDIGEFE